MDMMDERAGVSLWRRISEAIHGEIEQGRYKAEERLPSSADLAQRFSVNRHTIHKAIQHLQAEGVLRIERGRGAYAVVNTREFRIGPRRRFEQNLLTEPSDTDRRKIIALERSRPDKDIAKLLGLRLSDEVLVVSILGERDRLPIMLTHDHFVLKRMPGIEAAFRAVQAKAPKHFTTTETLMSAGISDWRRKSIHIRARSSRREEALHLKLAPTDPVLITTSLQVDAGEHPLWYSYSVFSSSRSTLVVGL